jgi:formate dehydrogenase major subunit
LPTKIGNRAAVIIQEGFHDTKDLDGLFSGYQEEKHTWDVAKGPWGYKGVGDGEKLDGQANDTAGKDQHGVYGYGLMSGATTHARRREELTEAPTAQPEGGFAHGS